MSCVARKSVFGGSDKVRHKPGCTEDDLMLETSDLETRGIVLSKALISCAVIAYMQKADFLMTFLK